MSRPVSREAFMRVASKTLTKSFEGERRRKMHIKAGTLYRIVKTDKQLWTDSDGWLWVFTGEFEKDSLHSNLPIFKSLTTGHQEWLPLEWMEEVKEDTID